MVKVHFFNWNTDSLDVENELDINGDVIDFLIENIPHLQFEATDNEADLENNWIYWFRSENENDAVKAIYGALSSMIKPHSNMNFTVNIEQW